MEWVPVTDLDTFKGVIKEKAETSTAFVMFESQSLIRPWLREIRSKCNLQALNRVNMTSHMNSIIFIP